MKDLKPKFAFYVLAYLLFFSLQLVVVVLIWIGITGEFLTNVRVLILALLFLGINGLTVGGSFASALAKALVKRVQNAEHKTVFKRFFEEERDP